MRRDAIILPRRGAKRYNRNMEPKPLTETNPYLRDLVPPPSRGL